MMVVVSSDGAIKATSDSVGPRRLGGSLYFVDVCSRKRSVWEYNRALSK